VLIPQLGVFAQLYFFDAEHDKSITSTDVTVVTATDGVASLLINGYSASQVTLLLSQLRALLCDMGRIGDMFQAASTNDVTFWVLHPTIERVWHLERLNQAKKLVVFNETWDNSENTCVGHRSFDYTPFKNVFDSKNAIYRNDELYNLLFPDNDNLPFVYHHFRFHHCELLGMVHSVQSIMGSVLLFILFVCCYCCCVQGLI
jgi:hypothetical protein